MRLLIISHTPHYLNDGQVVGWGPTVREISQLAKIFDDIVHLAPLHEGPAPKHALLYAASNVHFRALPPAGGDTLMEKLSILRRIPGWLRAMQEEMQLADSVHIRCPAGISLVALLAVRRWTRGKPVWVKYAGNWDSYPGQPLSYKFQRWFVKQNFHKGVVTINGHCDDNQKHIYSFHNPSFSITEYESAAESARNKQLNLPLKLLFVGNLTRAKGVHYVLEIAKCLQEKGVDFLMWLIGDGPDRSGFEAFISQNDLDEKVQFTGWQPMTALSQYYQKAHFIILPSSSEGWPKVLSEAMAYGVVPLASKISIIPKTLEQAQAGLAITAEDTEVYVSAILSYTQNEMIWKHSSVNGIQAASYFTYEHYLSEVKKLYQRSWQIELNHG